MLNDLLFWISGKLKAKAIKGPEGEPYLERYMLFRTKKGAVFLHRFLASDPDRGLHDHPWGKSVSFIVCGGYTERRLEGQGADGRPTMVARRMAPGRLNVIRGDDFHQVVLDTGRPAWTIFYHGERIKPWGFSIPKTASREPGPWDEERFETFVDNAPETPWEKTAPRGAALGGRMPKDYVVRNAHSLEASRRRGEGEAEAGA